MYGFEAHIAANRRNTVLLILVFIILLGVLGYFAGFFLTGSPPEGATAQEIAEHNTAQVVLGMFLMSFFLIIALVSTGVSYWFSDRIITSMVRARPVNPAIYTERVYGDYVEGLVLACGLEAVPKAYVIESPAMNAFATGRDPKHSIIAVTTGLIEKLDRQELEGVIAHEMSHIYNRDILLMGVAAVLVGGIAMFCNFMLRMFMWGGAGRNNDRQDSRSSSGGGLLIIIGIVFMILAPLFANLLNMMISRKREYLADATAVKLTRNPEGLTKALEKISGSDEKMPFVEKELSALFIDHPQKLNVSGLFATHPPIEDRIRALKDM